MAAQVAQAVTMHDPQACGQRKRARQTFPHRFDQMVITDEEFGAAQVHVTIFQDGLTASNSRLAAFIQIDLAQARCDMPRCSVAQRDAVNLDDWHYKGAG